MSDPQHTTRPNGPEQAVRERLARMGTELELLGKQLQTEPEKALPELCELRRYLAALLFDESTLVQLLRDRAVLPELDLPTFTAGELQIDFAHRIVTMAGREVHLTPIEYDLLRCLVQSNGRVLTHQQLLTRVWGTEYAEDTRTLRVHIVHLRDKLEADTTNPRYIHTETRIGYRFRYSP